MVEPRKQVEAQPGADPDAIALRDGVHRLIGGLMLVFVGFVTINIVRWHPSHPPAEIALDLTMVGLLALAWFGTPRLRPTRDNGHTLVLVFSLAATANVVGSTLVTHDVANMVYLPYITIAVSAVALSRGLFCAIASLTFVAAGLTAWPLDGSSLITQLTANGAAAVAGYAILAARIRSSERIREMRAVDALRKSAIEDALTRLGAELAERERAERDREVVLERQAALEAQLQRAQKLESIGVLAGGMAHDMNNVLAAITSIATAACEYPSVDAAARDDLRQIIAASQQGAALTRNLLGFAGRGKQRTERVDVANTVIGVVDLLRRTIPKGIELEAELAEDEMWVAGDSGQLSHVVMNLCLNAVDAIGERGRIVVRTGQRSVDESDPQLRAGSYVRISVADDGAGMSAETAARVFEPFFSTKTEKGRSGLGLSMVYGTARQHGGDVRIDSEVGRGTTVEVLLPPLEDAPRVRIATPLVARIPPGLRVLVIDDEPLVRRGTQRLLEVLGARVASVASGEEGVALFREEHADIDCVLLDLAMPVMNGAETFRLLREIDGDARVIVASGYPRGHDVDELVEAGVCAYLCKPYAKEALIQALRIAAPSGGRSTAHTTSRA